METVDVVERTDRDVAMPVPDADSAKDKPAETGSTS